MKNLINIVKNSKLIIASLIMLVFVTGFSIGYQLSWHYKQCDTVWLDDGLVPNPNK